MITIAHTTHTPTLSEIPFALGEVLRRNAAREARRARRRLFLSSVFRPLSSAKRVHRARIGSETIESNLPLR